MLLTTLFCMQRAMARASRARQRAQRSTGARRRASHLRSEPSAHLDAERLELCARGRLRAGRLEELVPVVLAARLALRQAVRLANLAREEDA